jgi:hypothetical protein
MIKNIHTNPFLLNDLNIKLNNKKDAKESNSLNFEGKLLSDIPSQKLHPSLFGVNLNNNEISFNGKIRIPSFPIEDIEFIQGLLNRCKYGKANLIKTPGNFRIEYDEKFVKLHNFRIPDEGSDIHGICEELTYKVGKILQEKFGEKYLFYDVKTVHPKYCFDHHCLIALNNNEESRQKVSKLIQNSQAGFKLAQEMIDKIQNGNFNFGDMIKIEEQLKKLAPSSEDIEGSLFIDPSFNKIQKFSSDGIMEKHLKIAIFDLEEINPSKHEPYCFPNIVPEFGIPLGFVKDLAPKLCQELGQEAILVMKFTKNDKLFSSTIESLSENGFFEVIDNIETKLGEDNPIVKFLKNLK